MVKRMLVLLGESWFFIFIIIILFFFLHEISKLVNVHEQQIYLKISWKIILYDMFSLMF